MENVMHQTERGAIAESVAATWALKNGWVVLWPNRGQAPKYDLVIDNEGAQLWRVQIKRAYLKDGVLVANLYHGKNERYSPLDIDVLLIVEVDTGTLWWLPVKDAGNRGRVRLGTPRMEKYRVITG